MTEEERLRFAFLLDKGFRWRDHPQQSLKYIWEKLTGIEFNELSSGSLYYKWARQTWSMFGESGFPYHQLHFEFFIMLSSTTAEELGISKDSYEDLKELCKTARF